MGKNGAKLGIDWDAQPLGIERDRVLAKRLCCSASAVREARIKRGIPSPNRKFAPAFREHERIVQDFGVLHDREIAEKYGISYHSVRRVRVQRGLPTKRGSWDRVPDLGTVPDIVIAKRLGVDYTVVAQARWNRNIQKWTEVRACACGERFTAFHRTHRFCSERCRSYWHVLVKEGDAPEVANLKLALAALRRTAKRK